MDGDAGGTGLEGTRGVALNAFLEVLLMMQRVRVILVASLCLGFALLAELLTSRATLERRVIAVDAKPDVRPIAGSSTGTTLVRFFLQPNDHLNLSLR